MVGLIRNMLGKISCSVIPWAGFGGVPAISAVAHSNKPTSMLSIGKVGASPRDRFSEAETSSLARFAVDPRDLLKGTASRFLGDFESMRRCVALVGLCGMTTGYEGNPHLERLRRQACPDGIPVSWRDWERLLTADNCDLARLPELMREAKKRGEFKFTNPYRLRSLMEAVRNAPIDPEKAQNILNQIDSFLRKTLEPEKTRILNILGRVKGGSSQKRFVRDLEILGIRAALGCEESLNELIGIVQKSKSSAFSRAVDALGILGNPAAVDALIDKIHYEHLKNQTIHSSVVDALGKIGGDKAIAALLSVMDEAMADRFVSTSIIRALGRSHARQAVGKLIGILNDPRFDLTKLAEEGHSRFSDEAAARESIIRETIFALAKIGGEEAIATLKGLLSHPEEFVVRCATTAMANFGGRAYAETIRGLLSKQDMSEYAQIHAILRYGQVGGADAVDHLSRLLKKSDLSKDDRAHVIKALGKNGSPQADEILYQLLASDSEEIRIAVIGALKEIGDKRAADAIFGAFSREDLSLNERLHAAAALSMMADSGAVDFLVGVVKDDESNDENKQYAAYALGVLGKVGLEKVLQAGLFGVGQNKALGNSADSFEKENLNVLTIIFFQAFVGGYRFYPYFLPSFSRAVFDETF